MLFRSNDTATTEIYTEENTLSLHDALPISLVAGVVFPLVLEQLGVIQSSIEVTRGGIEIHAPVVMSAWLLTPAIVLYVASTVATALMIGRASRVQEVAARERLHLQAWQLRHLLRR